MILYHIAAHCPQCGERHLHAAVLPGDPRFTRYTCPEAAGGCGADFYEIGDQTFLMPDGRHTPTQEKV